ncbi:cytochrome P450 [Durotheca rogersii]|uniref:cytochrome P450 n=1 Tax=Durotheca rogersii TaxID=419775 RepID=UPI00221EBAB1|nr:cytochrome P450 [Durotheca rogersii]KAI5868307.1 cytochrome P450 [Durotheca rogersii]
MAILSWRAVTVISLVTSYLDSFFQPSWSKSRLFGVFVGAWAFQFLLYAAWKVILWPKVFSPLRHLPQPKGNTFWLGHFGKIKAEPTGIPMREWAATIPNDGVIRYLGFLNQERLLLTSPKALADVLVTRNYDFQKPEHIRFGLARLVGDGILVSEGDEHKFQRRNLLPAFAYRHIKDLYPSFWQKADEVVEAMTRTIAADPLSLADLPEGVAAAAAASGGGPTAVIEVGGWASRVTLDIIGLCGLGRDFGAVQNPDTELSRAYRGVFSPTPQAQQLAALSLVIPEWVVSRIPVQRNNDILAANATIRGVCRDLIREKRERQARSAAEKKRREAEGGAAPAEDAGRDRRDRDILSVAIESGAFSDDNLVDQLMTFLAAGHETTATAMTWAVYLLARHPEVLARLRAEVRAALPAPGSGRGVTSVEVDRLPYLTAVCSEVLRFYAPVPLTLREAAVDTEIAGHRVPRGTAIIVSPWATNLDTTLWGPDAHLFNPDRWLSPTAAAAAAAAEPAATANASGGASSNYAFLTFLHGPRSCIGLAFARAEFACLLAAWAGRFEFRLRYPEEEDERKIDIKGGVTARPQRGMHVYATVVEGW